MSHATPLLSLAMIVKDEEEFLPECLENIKPFVDEICIVDTGSSDNTLHIALSAGARVKSIAWNDDFSYARNESLKLCTGKWIFILDADERISPEHGRQLHQLAETTNNLCAYRLWTRNYTSNTTRSDFRYASTGDAWAGDFPGWFDSAKVRLFPNHPDIQFEGTVHETVLNSLQKLSIPILNHTEIIIHHYGEKRPKEKLLLKQKQYARLGEKKIQQSPENPYAYAELACQYAEMGLYLKACEYYRKALEKDPNHPEWWAELASILFITSHKKEAEQAYKVSLKMDPTCFLSLRNLSLLYIESKRWNEALDTLYTAEHHFPDNPEILHLIACVLYELGDKQKAQQYFHRSYTLSPGNPTSLQFLHLE